MKDYIDFSSANNLIGLLKKIPSFKIKLTNEERHVLGQNGNVLVVGRSGTGKTTTAVFRLFATEMLFHIRQHIFNKEEIQGEKNPFFMGKIGKLLDLHSLFITASPFLAIEI